jgi:hypothetical protein
LYFYSNPLTSYDAVGCPDCGHTPPTLIGIAIVIEIGQIGGENSLYSGAGIIRDRDINGDVWVTAVFRYKSEASKDLVKIRKVFLKMI